VQASTSLLVIVVVLAGTVVASLLKSPPGRRLEAGVGAAMQRMRWW
jgi:hypothetical protein